MWVCVVDVMDKVVFEGVFVDFCVGNVGGGFDMMWNNVGIGEGGWFEDVLYEVVVCVVDVNFKVVFIGVYVVLFYFKKVLGSLMFLMLLFLGIYGMLCIVVYLVIKYVVKGLIEVLSVEW